MSNCLSKQLGECCDILYITTKYILTTVQPQMKQLMATSPSWSCLFQLTVVSTTKLDFTGGPKSY